MRLWLLRHASAEDHAPSGRDADRRLSPDGRATCHELQAWIRKSGLELPGDIRVSPAQRTLETARLVLGHQPRPDPVTDSRLWNASVGDLVALIDQAGHTRNGLMLIAHNPGLEGLVRWFGGRLPVAGMKAGTLSILEISHPPAPGSSETLGVFQPSEAV